MNYTKAQWLTIAICLLLCVALIIWDIVLAVDSFQGNTISAVTVDLSQKVWFIPYAFGCVAGHVWGNRKAKFDKLFVFSTMIIIGVALVGLSTMVPPFPLSSLASFLFGVLIGYLVWPNRGLDGG